jgi:hypothetical protein
MASELYRFPGYVLFPVLRQHSLTVEHGLENQWRGR